MTTKGVIIYLAIHRFSSTHYDMTSFALDRKKYEFVVGKKKKL